MGEKGVSRLLFPLPQALMMMQVIFICSPEHIFHNADTEKLVYSSPPMCNYIIVKYLYKKYFSDNALYS